MPDQKPPEPRPASWLTGLIVVLAVVVAYVGFARVSIFWTTAISTVIVVGLVIFLWREGSRKQGR